MGEWNNTAYVNTGDMDAVADALATVFRHEHMQVIPKPAERTPADYDPMQYGGASENSVWGLALLPGVADWIVILTAPFELLCESPEQQHRPRLAEIAARLGCDAFQLNLYDGCSLLLLEASAEGAFEISGFNGQSSDPEVWHGFVIAFENLEAGFRLIDVPDELSGAFAHDSVAVVQKVTHTFAGQSAPYCDNMVQVTKLVPHGELGIAGARELYFRRTVGKDAGP
jgi:hypothetical protein